MKAWSMHYNDKTHVPAHSAAHSPPTCHSQMILKFMTLKNSIPLNNTYLKTPPPHPSFLPPFLHPPPSPLRRFLHHLHYHHPLRPFLYHHFLHYLHHLPKFSPSLPPPLAIPLTSPPLSSSPAPSRPLSLAYLSPAITCLGTILGVNARYLKAHGEGEKREDSRLYASMGPCAMKSLHDELCRREEKVCRIR